MKFTLETRRQSPVEYWNGRQELPPDIHVPSSAISLAEFQLLSLLGTLHGHLTAYDILVGAESGTQKDRDIVAVLTAFQWYVFPRMPLSHYTNSEERLDMDKGAKSVLEKGGTQECILSTKN
jgi:hypothetical protein